MFHTLFRRHLQRDPSELSAAEFIKKKSRRLCQIIHASLCQACARRCNLIEELIRLLSFLLDPVTLF